MRYSIGFNTNYSLIKQKFESRYFLSQHGMIDDCEILDRRVEFKDIEKAKFFDDWFSKLEQTETILPSAIELNKINSFSIKASVAVPKDKHINVYCSSDGGDAAYEIWKLFKLLNGRFWLVETTDTRFGSIAFQTVLLEDESDTCTVMCIFDGLKSDHELSGRFSIAVNSASLRANTISSGSLTVANNGNLCFS
jgi:hypothetical protein